MSDRARRAERFLRACRREPTDCTPIWLMRQAGRYMEEYRALRAKHTLLEICKTPELALQVTLQPIRLGVDAAILFADILLPLEPMGAPFSFEKGEGPVIHRPVNDAQDIDRLIVCDPHEGLGYVLEAIRLIRRELDGVVPLIGFAGAPFTLASYLVEGGRSSHFLRTKQLMYQRPDAWHALMDKLSRVVRSFLKAQIEAGAQAIQLFDSWVGSLGPADYVEYVAPHVRSILEDLAPPEVPVIHFGTGTTTLLRHMREAGGTVIGVDWRMPIDEARTLLGPGVALQGNLDPTLLCSGPVRAIEQRADDVLRRAGRSAHVFNLGHGVLPETPVEHVQRLIQYVHERSAAMEPTTP